MPSRLSLHATPMVAVRGVAAPSIPPRRASTTRQRLPIENWREGGFAQEIQTARIATEPTAVRIISATPGANAQRKLLLELPCGFFPPGPRAKAWPAH